MSLNFTGRTAIVTGGAQGIGQAVCQTLHQAGANVVIADLNVERAQESVAQYRERPPTIVQTDISQESSVKKLYAAVLAQFGQVDIVVNSAGIYRQIPILEIEVADWDQVLAVNLRGTFLMGREAFRVMKPRGQGRIINVAS